MEIGNKLKEKRTSAGLSQEALAERIGVTRQTISSWENNRSYPDIGSILKLSDLYDVSLDELLKEDENMRKHVEQSGELPRKYWNILFEIAILLLPFGLLVASWGLYGVGLTMQIIGLLMMPPLWLARHKLFGMSSKDMRNSFIGWGMYVGASILRLFCGADAGGTFLAFGISMISLVGLLFIYSYGFYLERGTRFWLVIALYIGIPIYVLGSQLLGQFEDTGAFSKAQPFGSDYRIVSVEYGDAVTDHPTITMDMYALGNGLKIDENRIGKFEYVQPTKSQQETILGIWHLIPEDEPDALYKLQVDTEDVTTLSYFIDDQLQWEWIIAKVPKLWFVVNNREFNAAYPMEWFSEGTYAGDFTMNYGRLDASSEVYFQCSDKSVETLTVVEEYHHSDQVELQEYQLHKDKNGNFPLTDEFTRRYEDGDQFAVYSIPWVGGEFLFKLEWK